MYEKEFEPICKIEENLGILTTTGWGYFKAIYIEPLPPSEDLILDFGAIANGGSVKDQEIDLLEMKTDELGQFRFEPLDNIKIKVAQPTGAARFTIKNKVVRVSQLSCARDPSLKHTEVFVFENNNIWFTEVVNDSGADLPASRVQFYGYRYMLEKLTSKPEKLTYVVATGKPSKE